MTTHKTRQFAVQHCRRSLWEITRYLRGGILVEELVTDLMLCREAFGIRASETLGGEG